MSPTKAAAVLCAFLISGSAMAQTLMPPTDAAPAAKAAASAKAAPKLIYLPADFLAHPGTLVPPPPTPDSAEGKRDLAAVKLLQASADPARIALAAADDKNETVWFYGDVLPGFTKATLPMTAKLFDAAENDEEIEADRFKTFFARVRPFDLDKTLQVCVPTAYHAKARSYPSGHATLGYSLGLVLAHLIPEKADAILTRARVYGENRVICGVHFPSDIAASQALGTAVALEFMRAPAFKTAFAAAKAELVAAGLTK